MNARNRFGALLAASALVMAIASVTTAAPPGLTYTITVDKSASPMTVPTLGGTVVYTVAVTNTGTGSIMQVTIDDGMAGCTLAGPNNDQASGPSKGKLDPAETWNYTCTVTGVTPGTQNTASVTACHDNGGCGSSPDATGSDSVTVGQGTDPTPTPFVPTPTPAVPTPTPFVPTPTPFVPTPTPFVPTPSPFVPTPTPDAPTPTPFVPTPTPDAPTPTPFVPTPTPFVATPTPDAPTPTPGTDDTPVPQDTPDPENTPDPTGGGAGVDATVPTTDTANGSGAARPGDRGWMLVISLGLLLASIVVVSPSKPSRERTTTR